MSDKRTQQIGRVIKLLRNQRKKTQEVLAAEAQVDQGNLSRLERGKQMVGLSALEALVSAMNLSMAEFWQLLDDDEQHRLGPVRALDSVRVPLISWVQAGTWSDPGHVASKDEADQWVTTHTKVGKRAYALRVRGDSMTNPRGEPSFPAGTIIVIDPSRPAVDGALAIIRTEVGHEATFKRLHMEAGRTLLVPLNPQFPAMPAPEGAHVCGVVVAKAEVAL